jgi:hypothetical protein
MTGPVASRGRCEDEKEAEANRLDVDSDGYENLMRCMVGTRLLIILPSIILPDLEGPPAIMAAIAQKTGTAELSRAELWTSGGFSEHLILKRDDAPGDLVTLTHEFV